MRSSQPKRDSVPLAENPYMRSTSSIYTGGERAIFSKHSAVRRNILVLAIMGGICIIMAAVLIGFALGKDVGLAEADPSDAPIAQTEPVQVHAEGGSDTA